jgi:hypothetical protein
MCIFYTKLVTISLLLDDDKIYKQSKDINSMVLKDLSMGELGDWSDTIIIHLYDNYLKNNSRLTTAYYLLLLDAIPTVTAGIDYNNESEIPPGGRISDIRHKGFKKYHQIIDQGIEEMVRQTLAASSCLDFGCGGGNRIRQLRKLGAAMIDGAYRSNEELWHPRGVEEGYFKELENEGSIMVDFNKDPSFSRLRRGYDFIFSHRVFEIPIVMNYQPEFAPCVNAVLNLSQKGLSVHSTWPNPLEITPRYLEDEDYYEYPPPSADNPSYSRLMEQRRVFIENHRKTGIVPFFKKDFGILDYANCEFEPGLRKMKMIRQYDGREEVIGFGPHAHTSGGGYILISRKSVE